MKQRLLTFLSMVALAVVSMAQMTWTAPAPKGSDLSSSDRDTVYLYNVGAAQFLHAGTAWGTHAVVKSLGLPVRLTSTTTEAGATYWQIYFFEGSKSKQMLFNDNGSDCFVDLNNQDVTKSYWAFSKVGDYYRIQSFSTAVSDPEAFDASLFFGQSPLRTDFDQNGNTLDSHIGCFADMKADEEEAHIDWIIVTKRAYDEWNAVNGLKYKLLDLINTAEDFGVTPTDAIAVLNNANATAADVQAAIDGIKEVIINGLDDQASELNPVDVTTLFITNPDFNNKSTDGWVLTGSYAKTQNNRNHNIQYDDGTETDEVGLDTGGWLEFWKSGGIDADQDAHQVIKDLPAGVYSLGLVGVGTGGQLYAITNGIEQTAPLTQYLQHVDFQFLHVGGDLTFGFKFSPTGSVAWVAVDKFRLYYLGKSTEDETLTMLRKAFDQYEPYTTDYKISEALMAEAITVLDNAQKLINDRSDDKEANTAAINAINNMTARISAEAAAYTKLDNFINNTIANDLTRYADSESPAIQGLYTQITDFEEEFAAAYNDASWNTDEINAKIEAYNQAVSAALEARRQEVKVQLDEAAATGEALAEPLDITELYSDMAFDYTTSQVAHTDGLGDWVNETKTGNFKTAYSTAEVWNVHPFNIYRELPDLPKGKYTIQVKAFYRTTNNLDNYQNYDAAAQPLAFLYANNSQKGLTNVAELARDEKWFDNDAALTSDGTTDADGNPVYNSAPFVPNSQQGAHTVFNSDEALAQKAVTEVAASVINEGDVLTIGIKGTEDLQDNCWVVWADVKVFYNGITTIDDELQALIDNAGTLKAFGVQATETLISEAIAAGEAAIGQDAATQVEAAQKLNAAVEASKRSEQLVDEIAALYPVYDEKRQTLEGDYTDTTFPDLMNTIGSAYSSEIFESNEQIEQWINGLKDSWNNYILSKAGIEGASVAEPFEISELIVNNTFDDATGDSTTTPSGWTAEFENNGGKGREGIMEFWGCSTFDIYQELPKLKDGYWRLEVDAFCRAGNTDDEIAAISTPDSIPFNQEYLYVSAKSFSKEKKVVQWSDLNAGAVVNNEENAEFISTLAKNDYSFTLGDVTTNFVAPNNQSQMATFIAAGRYHNTIDFAYQESDGPVRIGLKLIETMTNIWCPFDNFRLYYLGTTAPDAVESIAAGTQAAPAAIYTLDGRQASTLQRGINIVRRADGKVQKVLVK